MAVTMDGQSPIIMDTAGDEIATIFQGRDMNNTTPIPKLYLVGVEFIQGAAGRTILKHGAALGIAFESPDLQAGESYFLQCKRWVQNLYVAQIPGASKVLLHYA